MFPRCQIPSWPQPTTPLSLVVPMLQCSNAHTKPDPERTRSRYPLPASCELYQRTDDALGLRREAVRHTQKRVTKARATDGLALVVMDPCQMQSFLLEICGRETLLSFSLTRFSGVPSSFIHYFASSVRTLSLMETTIYHAWKSTLMPSDSCHLGQTERPPTGPYSTQVLSCVWARSESWSCPWGKTMNRIASDSSASQIVIRPRAPRTVPSILYVRVSISIDASALPTLSLPQLPVLRFFKNQFEFNGALLPSAFDALLISLPTTAPVLEPLFLKVDPLSTPGLGHQEIHCSWNKLVWPKYGFAAYMALKAQARWRSRGGDAHILDIPGGAKRCVIVLYGNMENKVLRLNIDARLLKAPRIRWDYHNAAGPSKFRVKEPRAKGSIPSEIQAISVYSEDLNITAGEDTGPCPRPSARDAQTRTPHTNTRLRRAEDTPYPTSRAVDLRNGCAGDTPSVLPRENAPHVAPAAAAHKLDVRAARLGGRSRSRLRLGKDVLKKEKRKMRRCDAMRLSTPSAHAHRPRANAWRRSPVIRTRLEGRSRRARTPSPRASRTSADGRRPQGMRPGARAAAEKKITQDPHTPRITIVWGQGWMTARARDTAKEESRNQAGSSTAQQGTRNKNGQRRKGTDNLNERSGKKKDEERKKIAPALPSDSARGGGPHNSRPTRRTARAACITNVCGSCARRPAPPQSRKYGRKKRERSSFAYACLDAAHQRPPPLSHRAVYCAPTHTPTCPRTRGRPTACLDKQSSTCKTRRGAAKTTRRFPLVSVPHPV
ncbi:hypothetical protein FB451DRAFT_1486446 [Mycena latifolia]|nr:hypothetical protein FB451DRAFT_1486446 [Mycena latifolia]